MKTRYSTLILSDIHLGNKHSKTNELIEFLKNVSCDKLILNGDIIDGWQLQKSGGRWRKRYTNFFKTIMRMMEKEDTKVIYVRGNHDDFLDQILPLRIMNFRLVKHYVHYSHGKKYFVLHGDLFDTVTSNLKWLAMLGDLGYNLLLWYNKRHNNIRRKRGLPYDSISQRIKKRVKRAVSYISDFEERINTFATYRHFDGIICGHIHQAENKYIGKTHYLNSGDWVESLTALAEDAEGNWSIISYEGMLHEEEIKKKTGEKVRA